MPDNQQREQGERLKKIRKDLGDDQIPFAERIGMSQSQLSRTEKGEYEISIKVLVKVIELGYNANWLVSGGGDMHLPAEFSQAAEAKVGYNKQEELDRLKAFLKEKFPDFKD